MEKTADAVVIGGGIMGSSVAHFLAKKGIGTVVLLEKRSLAAVSTGHSAANVRCSYSNPVTVQLALRAMEIFENDREVLGGDSGFQTTGHLVLMDPEHVDIGMAVLEVEKTQNTGTRIVGLDEIRELAPQLSMEGAVQATYQARAGYADPVRTVRTLVEQGEKHGLTAYEGVGATSIETNGDHVTGVTCDEGLIETPIVINAAGPWGKQIGASAGREYSLRWSRECDLLYKLPTDFGHFPIFADPYCKIYFRPQRDNMLLAGLDYPKAIEPLDIDDYDARLDDDSRGRIESGLFRRIPQLRDAEFERGWASIYTITDDWHPIVGAEPSLRGYYAFFGGSGHGFKLGPPLGEALADMITGDTPRIDIRQFRPTRFEEGEPFNSLWGEGNRA